MLSEYDSGNDSFSSNEEINPKIRRRQPRNKPRCKFSKQEDQTLIEAVHRLGVDRWTEVACCLKNRTQRQCRDRWNNYLSPEANLSQWTREEDQILERMVTIFNHRWSIISKHIPGRTCSSIRNRYFKLKRSMKKTLFADSSNITVGRDRQFVYQQINHVSQVYGAQTCEKHLSLNSGAGNENLNKSAKSGLPSIDNFPFIPRV